MPLYSHYIKMHNPDIVEDIIIHEGILESSHTSPVCCFIYHGWNPQRALECNTTWGGFNAHLLEEVYKREKSDQKVKAILRSLQLEDFRWDWLGKAQAHKGNEYEWFFLYAEERPQGACLIYHPEGSKLSTGDIFYVKFLAAAPWNRTSNIHERRFKGIGTMLLDVALKFAIEALGLRPGFSLHSLPQAVSFYRKYGMVHIEEENDGFLLYFELPEEIAKTVIQAG